MIATLEDFGVDLTGTSDSTAEVQEAVDNCDGLLFWNGGTVRIQDGTVKPTKPCRIIGPGIDQWRVGGAGANVVSSNPNNTIFDICASNFHIDGLNFPGHGSRYGANKGVAIKVGGTPGLVGDGTITGVTLSNISACSHSVAVHFVRASNYSMTRCDLQSYDAVISENLVHVDKGDSTISGCDFAADPTNGKCLKIKSSGGLRIHNNKFLNCQDSIYVEWLSGLSGGPKITNNHLENITRRGIFVYGDTTSVLHGLDIQGNWINGAIDSIFIDDTCPVLDANIQLNTIKGGATSIGINLGGRMTNFLCANNKLDGNGMNPSYGIFARSGSTGVIGPNMTRNFSMPIYNGSSAVVTSQF